MGTIDAGCNAPKSPSSVSSANWLKSTTMVLIKDGPDGCGKERDLNHITITIRAIGPPITLLRESSSCGRTVISSDEVLKACSVMPVASEARSGDGIAKGNTCKPNDIASLSKCSTSAAVSFSQVWCGSSSSFNGGTSTPASVRTFRSPASSRWSVSSVATCGVGSSTNSR